MRTSEHPRGAANPERGVGARRHSYVFVDEVLDDLTLVAMDRHREAKDLCVLPIDVRLPDDARLSLLERFAVAGREVGDDHIGNHAACLARRENSTADGGAALVAARLGVVQHLGTADDRSLAPAAEI